jgi:hypothetical protein
MSSLETKDAGGYVPAFSGGWVFAVSQHHIGLHR